LISVIRYLIDGLIAVGWVSSNGIVLLVLASKITPKINIV
jgi:hypothetical protein